MLTAPVEVFGSSSRSVLRRVAIVLAADDWMERRLVEVQAVNWKVAIVRAIHGTAADTWSIDELVAEHDRMQRTLVTVKHADGRSESMTELRLRLEYERAG